MSFPLEPRPGGRFAWCAVVMMLVACDRQQEPAQATLTAIDAPAAGPLAAAAADRQKASRAALDADWQSLAASIPDEATAIRGRIDGLAVQTRSRSASIGVDAARFRWQEDSVLWSKARAAFAAGNMTEAVATANTAKASFDALARQLDEP
jgi:hypothetical protein